MADAEHGLFDEPVTEPGSAEGEDQAGQQVAREIRNPLVNEWDVPEIEAVADPAEPGDGSGLEDGGS